MSSYNVTSTVPVALYTTSQETTLSLSSVIVNAISLISCLLIMISWFLFKPLRKLVYAFVFYMAISTSIRTISKMWGGHRQKGEFLCTLQGFLIVYGGLSTFWWMFSIAWVMYTIIFHPLKYWKDPLSDIKYNKRFLLINFSVPLLFAALPLFTGSYAPTGGWCFIDGKSVEGKIFRWLSYYAQLVLILLFSIFVYIRIYIHYVVNGHESEVRNVHKLYNRVKFYPLCLIIGYTVAVIRRFVGLWDINLGFEVAFMMSITTGLFGFMLFVVYGRLGKLNKLYRMRFPICNPLCDHLCCCLYSKELEEKRKQTEDKTEQDKNDRNTGDITAAALEAAASKTKHAELILDDR